MGMFRKRTRTINPAPFEVEITTELPVVGVSYRQDALRAVCGRRTADGVWTCHAVLVPEPDNSHDPRAVRVEIKGIHIGYLPKDDAARLQVGIQRVGSATVEAEIYTWKRDESDEDEEPALAVSVSADWSKFE